MSVSMKSSALFPSVAYAFPSPRSFLLPVPSYCSILPSVSCAVTSVEKGQEPSKNLKHGLVIGNASEVREIVGDHDAHIGNLEHGAIGVAAVTTGNRHVTGEVLHAFEQRGGLAEGLHGDIDKASGFFDQIDLSVTGGLLVHQGEDLVPRGGLVFANMANRIASHLTVEEEVGVALDQLVHGIGELLDHGGSILGGGHAIDTGHEPLLSDQIGGGLNADLGAVVFGLGGDQQDMLGKSLEEGVGLGSEVFANSGQGAVDIKAPNDLCPVSDQHDLR